MSLSASPASEHSALLAPIDDAASRHHRDRSGTMTSIASFARERPRSTASIVLAAFLALSLLLAAVGLVMIIFVVNSGRFAMRPSTPPPVRESFRTRLLLHSDDDPVQSVRSITGGLAGGESTVFVSQTSRIHASRPASFGPHIWSADGHAGWLVPLEELVLGPESVNVTTGQTKRRDDRAVNARRGCIDVEPGTNVSDTIKGARPRSPLGEGWIALTERGSCPFVSKVRYAQALGASAVIVGDWSNSNEDDDDGNVKGFRGFSSGLVTMYAPGDTSDVRVPSVFVARDSYVSLVKDWAEEGKVVGDDDERLHDDKREVKSLRMVMSRDELWTWPFLDVLIVLLFLPSLLTFTTLLFHRIVSFRRQRADRAPREVVEGLVSVVWAKDMEKGIPVEVVVSTPLDAETTTTTTVVVVESRPLQWWKRTFFSPFSTTPHPTVNESSPLISSPTPVTRIEKRVIAQSGCALCLDDFVVGQRVRVLPCGHCFHQGSGIQNRHHQSVSAVVPVQAQQQEEEDCMGIDVWLLRQKRICPVCRSSILPTEPTTSTANSTSNVQPSNAVDVPLLNQSENDNGEPVASSSRITTATQNPMRL